MTTELKIELMIQQLKNKIVELEEDSFKKKIHLDGAFFTDNEDVEEHYDRISNEIEEIEGEIELLEEKVAKLEEILEFEDFSYFYEEFNFEY